MNMQHVIKKRNGMLMAASLAFLPANDFVSTFEKLKNTVSKELNEFF